MTVSSHAPGRVEILGNHTDYNGGLVLSAAIDLGVSCTGRGLSDGSIRLRSRQMPGQIVLPATDELLPNSTWADYPLGVVHVLRGEGIGLGGFEAEFSSDLPAGAGLSSSAALEVCTAVFLCRLHGAAFEPMQLAKWCRRAENEFVGVNCGLLDQVSSVFGRRGHLVRLDCRDEQVRLLPLPAGVALLVVDTGVKHALTGGAYNERREQCFAAAAAMGVAHLCDATFEQLAACALPDIVARRAAHVLGENRRVAEAGAALQKGDLEMLGALLRQSHESSRTNFENSCPELDALVAIAAETPGVYGSRLTGGGFGGATVSLVEETRAAAAAESMVAEYRRRTGNPATARICHASDGAGSLSATASTRP